MTPEQYCEQRAGGRGSSLHYALLRVTPGQRAALLAVHAFALETGEWSAEPGVIARRLAYWSEELAATFRGAPRHPIGQALAAAIERFALEPAPFATLLAAASNDLRMDTVERHEELERTVLAGGDALGVLVAIIGEHLEPATRPAAAMLGRRLHYAARLRNLGREAHRGRTMLPLEHLRRFGLTARDLRSGGKPDAVAQLVGAESAQTIAALEAALEGLPPTDRPRLLPLVTLARIEQATLRELARHGARVLERGVALTPLRKLWIAWKCARADS